MTTNTPVEMLCRYRVKSARDNEFQALLVKHWKVLHDAGLATDEPARLLRAADKAGNVAYIEQFSWLTEGSAQTAHETPAVMQLWEPMGTLCEDMEFWEVEAFDG